ncbi:MAG: hypothetical protein M3124_09960 [Actinomycetota bacterium]|nr:hypothetical protein [Actinomycetota bacterium]
MSVLMASDLARAVTEAPPSRDRGESVEAAAFSRVAAVAFPALGRSIPWVPLATAALVSTLVVGWRHGHAAAVPLQLVAILLSSAAGFALDDPAAETLAASPTSLLRRRLLRLLLVGPPVAVVWGLLLWWQGTDGAEETWALMLLFAGLLGLSMGVSGIAGRRSAKGSGGIVVPPAIFVLLILSTVIPREWRPLPLGDVPGGWDQIYLRWGAAAVLGTIAFLTSSRDPATRAIRAFVRHRNPLLRSLLHR